ncbi:MAG: ribosome small subunit-dependent GTPase A [Eubacterium sp.]|nr:ribosome small subunit-dependent GTPase A [Eubacterium sp.]
MQGKIIKGIAGFYYVDSDDGIFECKAKGIFRNKNVKPLVGDNVEFEITHDADKEGNITEILERDNELIRPAVANIDQAMIVFALKAPNPNVNLLDKLLVCMEYQNIETIICFNKTDIADMDFAEGLASIYRNAGYKVIFTSATENEGVEEVKAALRGKSTVFAGPSGVGKSSMLNAIKQDAVMETGDISEKIGRGKHTTRHSEIFKTDHDTYVFDTPGFGSLFIPGMTKEKLEDCFPEFSLYTNECRFIGCAHINEPDCAVKEALEEGKISESRYESYKAFYEELKEQENKYD